MCIRDRHITAKEEPDYRQLYEELQVQQQFTLSHVDVYKRQINLCPAATNLANTPAAFLLLAFCSARLMTIPTVSLVISFVTKSTSVPL